MIETIAGKESRPTSARHDGRVTHSSPPIVLELILVLDPTVDFLLKASPAPVAVGGRSGLLAPGFLATGYWLLATGSAKFRRANLRCRFGVCA
jgi:hypothetical protein